MHWKHEKYVWRRIKMKIGSKCFASVWQPVNYVMMECFAEEAQLRDIHRGWSTSIVKAIMIDEWFSSCHWNCPLVLCLCRRRLANSFTILMSRPLSTQEEEQKMCRLSVLEPMIPRISIWLWQRLNSVFQRSQQRVSPSAVQSDQRVTWVT